MSEERMNGRGIPKSLITIFSLTAWFAVFILIAATLWNIYGPEKAVPDEKRQDAGLKVVDQMADQIRKQRGDTKQVILLHFANDPTDFVTDSIRSKMNSSGILDLEDTTLTEKIQKKLRLRNKGYSSREVALKAVKGKDADGVLWGKVEQFESFKNGAILKGSWQLVSISSGKVICEGKFNVDTSKDASAKVAEKVDQIAEKMTPIAKATQTVPWYSRFLIFVLVILLLPILTISFLRTMVAKRSNAINATILGIYTVIGMIFAFFMIGAYFASAWSVILFIMASVLAFIYNYFMMSFALKLES